MADLNGDGKTDLATANWRVKTVSILLNRGDGSFEPKRDYAIGTAGGFAVGDLTYWPVVEVVKQLDALPSDEQAAAAVLSLPA